MRLRQRLEPQVELARHLRDLDLVRGQALGVHVRQLRHRAARTTRPVPRRGRRRRSGRSRARPRSSGAQTGSSVHQRSTTRHSSRTTSTPWRFTRRGDPSKRSSTRAGRGCVQSRGTRSARCSGIRDQGATSTTLATAPAPALARTWRRPSRRRLCTLVSFRPDQRELAAVRLRQREQLDPERENGCGELCELRPERRSQNAPLRTGLAQRHGATPRASPDEPRRERDLADLSPAALGAGEDPVEECRQRPPEGELVARAPPGTRAARRSPPAACGP